MRLALSLGGMTVDEMVQRMSESELDGWVAFNAKHGLPWMRQELYLAQVAQMTAGGKLDDYVLRPREAEVDEIEATPELTIRSLENVGTGKVLYLKLPKQEGGDSWQAA